MVALIKGLATGPARPRASAARPAPTFYRDRAKRALDVALVLLSAPVTLPLIAAMALLVSLDGAAPFYRQRRIGRAGRVFGLWKIRTMVPRRRRAARGPPRRPPRRGC